MRDTLGCNDPVAERRYAYAQSAARDGDWRAATDVLEQALELAPNWAPAWFALGEARERLGEKAGAADAFGAALAADPSDAQGARGRLALLAKDRGSTHFPPPMSRGCSTITPRASTRIWQANSAIADPNSSPPRSIGSIRGVFRAVSIWAAEPA